MGVRVVTPSPKMSAAGASPSTPPSAPGTARVGGRTLPGHGQPVSGRVLVVEDEPDARELLRRVLERHGLEVMESADASSAMRMLFGERPDLVLLDLGLPDVDGSALIARIRELTDIPLIVVTGQIGEDTTVESLRAGADDYVVKPFGVQELLARVEALLRRVPAPSDQPAIYADELIEIDFASLEVRANGDVVDLTPQQLRLLSVLVEHRGQVLS